MNRRAGRNASPERPGSTHLRAFREHLLLQIDGALPQFRRAGEDDEAFSRIAAAVRRRVQASAAVDRVEASGTGDARRRERLLRSYRDALLNYLEAIRKPDWSARWELHEGSAEDLASLDEESWPEMTARALLDITLHEGDESECQVADLWLAGLVGSLMGDEGERDRLKRQVTGLVSRIDANTAVWRKAQKLSRESLSGRIRERDERWAASVEAERKKRRAKGLSERPVVGIVAKRLGIPSWKLRRAVRAVSGNQANT